MIKLSPLSGIAASLLMFGLNAPAQALSIQAWVSSRGADAAGCGAQTRPCRTFQFAHDAVVAAGGEIDVLDPGQYGPVTISKAISIVNDGPGGAGVQQPNGTPTAITINAGPHDAIYLRGLTLDGLGAGANGISVNSDGSLTIINCTARHFTNYGIKIAGGPATISNTTISDNGNFGIFVDGSYAVISGTTVLNNNVGIASGPSTIVADSKIINNRFADVEAPLIGRSVFSCTVSLCQAISFGGDSLAGAGSFPVGTLPTN